MTKQCFGSVNSKRIKRNKEGLKGMNKQALSEEVRNLKAENQMLKDELISLKALLFLRDKVDERIGKIITNIR